MLKALDPRWPIGIEERWISQTPWQRIERIYSEGFLKSDPRVDRHAWITLNGADNQNLVECLPWNYLGQERGLSAIVAYDILDHLPSLDHAVRFLSDCKSALKKGGVMYAMFHPYKSRVGTHLFRQNKAYIHMVTRARGIHTLLIDKPLESYRRMISSSGLTVDKESVYTEFIEDYFLRYKLDKDCEIQFVEYLIHN